MQPKVSHSLSHLNELFTSFSQIDLPKSEYIVFFVYLSGDRLYTAADETLFVYSMSDHTSPIATYRLGGMCFSVIIADNLLYLGGDEKLHIFELTTFITQPLIQFKVIDTKDWVRKILRVGNQLILGEEGGYL